MKHKPSLIMALMMAFATLAPAAHAAPAPQTAANPSQHSKEIALKLFTAVRIDQQMNLVLRTMLPPMVQGQMEGLTDDEKAIVLTTTFEAMTAVLPKMLDAMAEKYAMTFTDQQMLDAIAFYDSASGQAFLSKQEELSSAGSQIMQSLMPELRAEMQRRLCAKVNCTAAGGVTRS